MLVTVIIAAVLSVVFLDNIQAANELLVSIGAGAGLVYIMRWFWPRINAYSELASDQMAAKLLVNIACTTLIWLVVTFLTPPEDESTLRNFYTRCKPSGPWWRKFAAERNLEAPQKDAKLGLDWLLGSFMVWAAILFVGTLLLGGGHAVIYGLALVGTALYLVFRLRPGSAATS